MLIIAGITIALAFSLRVVQGDRVAFWFLPQHPLPQTCGSRALFGMDCPGCGLTRSFVFLAHGHWNAALHVHRVGWVLALATVLQIPYRIIALRTGYILPAPIARNISRGLIILLIGNWVLGII
ncbi:MAG: hypothetical protein JWP03_4444 [Phycisphaerales bacterium]|jgi:hypothetical protein|nr:hypothetical protein [Phycisphaerales bacterium]